MVRGRNERGSRGYLWFVFPGEMPSEWEVPLAKVTSRAGFVLGAPEQALAQVGPGLGALLPGSCRGVHFCWRIWLHTGERLLQGYFMFFPPSFLSFSPPFSARADFMSHVKNILISGHY